MINPLEQGIDREQNGWSKSNEYSLVNDRYQQGSDHQAVQAGEDQEFAEQLADIRQLISLAGAEEAAEGPVVHDNELDVDATFQFHRANYQNKTFTNKTKKQKQKDKKSVPARFQTKRIPQIEEINVEDVPDMSQASYAKIISISELNTNRKMSQQFNKMYQQRRMTKRQSKFDIPSLNQID